MAIVTPGGHYLGRKRDKPDAHDKRYSVTHARTVTLPPRVDLRTTRPWYPPVFDQSTLGSCGPTSADAFNIFLYPEMATTGFSRLQLYYDVRVLEYTVPEDAGVQTRDLFVSLKKTGVAPEPDWPYDISKFTVLPPQQAVTDAAKYKIGSYSRLVQTASYLNCLATGYPFILGFECFESIDSDQLAQTGVMPYPVRGEQIVGGHDVLVIGYDMNFTANPDFKRSGIDPRTVSNHALLIRNSWGPDWGLDGHFYMPLEYATNPSVGGDAWTARK